MSRYSRGPTISRQLTDDEEALDARSSSFLQSESRMPEAFGTSSQRYAWMEKDLRMRAMQAASLKQEGDLATDLGDKRALAKQDTFANEEELAARKGLNKVDELVAGGMDYDEATLKTSSEMDLGLNEMFGGATAERSRLWMSPEDKAHKQAKQKLESLQIDKNTMDAESQLEMIKQDPQGYKDALKGMMKAGQISAAAAPAAARAKALYDRQALDEAEARADHIRTLGDGTEDSLASLTHAFSEAGLGGVTSPEKVVKMFGGEGSKNILLALSNPDFMQDEFKGNEELSSAFSAALNTLTDDSIEASEADKRQAKSLVLSYAGKHKAYYEKAAEQKALAADALKAREANNTELGNSFKSASDAIDKIISGEDVANDSATRQAVISAGLGFIDRFRSLSTPGTDAIFDEYQGFLDELAGESPESIDVKQTARAVRNHMTNFIKDYKELQNGGAAPPANDSKSSESASVIPESKPDVKQGDTVFTWNGEKYIPKK